MIKHNSDILNKLFFRELKELIDKYNKIDEDTKEKIEMIVTNLKDEEFQSYIMRNLDKLLDILKCTHNWILGYYFPTYSICISFW